MKSWPWRRLAATSALMSSSFSTDFFQAHAGNSGVIWSVLLYLGTGSWISFFFSAFLFLLSAALLDIAFFPIRATTRVFLRMRSGAKWWGTVALELDDRASSDARAIYVEHERANGSGETEGMISSI